MPRFRFRWSGDCQRVSCHETFESYVSQKNRIHPVRVVASAGSWRWMLTDSLRTIKPAVTANIMSFACCQASSPASPRSQSGQRGVNQKCTMSVKSLQSAKNPTQISTRSSPALTVDLKRKSPTFLTKISDGRFSPEHSESLTDPAPVVVKSGAQCTTFASSQAHPVGKRQWHFDIVCENLGLVPSAVRQALARLKHLSARPPHLTRRRVRKSGLRLSSVSEHAGPPAKRSATVTL